MSEISLLPVLPGTVSSKDKRTLAEVGVIVIEHADPSSLRLLRPQSEINHGDMLAAAVAAIADGKYSDGDNVRKHFCSLLNKILNIDAAIAAEVTK